MHMIPLETRLTRHEYARFAATCRRLGLRTEQFQISGDFLYRPDAAPPTLVRQLCVRQLDAGSTRRYQVWHFSDWLAAFEDDLRKGLFHARRDDAWTESRRIDPGEPR